MLPQRKITDISFKQINRILKPEGSFVSQQMTFWGERKCKQDERLYEFGGILTSREDASRR
jgi:hypothetical protein